MTTKELYEKLNSYWQFEKGDKILSTIIKSILLLLAGALLGLIITDLHANVALNNSEVVIFILSFALFIVMEFRTIKKEKAFPISILDHLKATKELEVKNKRYTRKERIDEYISNSISSLNSNTCPIQAVGEETNQLCHQDIKDSLADVLNDIVDRTQNFLDCDYTKYSVAIFIKNIYDPHSIKGSITLKPVSFVFRDDFLIADFFPQNIEHITNENALKFYLQTKIIESINLSSYISEHKTFEDGNNYLFLFAPIPNVCEVCPPDGTIVIMSKQNENAPKDLENILKIFGQIVANWLSKFNDCVYQDKK